MNSASIRQGRSFGLWRVLLVAAGTFGLTMGTHLPNSRRESAQPLEPGGLGFGIVGGFPHSNEAP
jgi:hypothetical protein